MNPHQKGRCNDEMTARPKHLIYIPASPHRPRQVLKHLIGYNQIELAIERFGADVEFGKLCGCIRAKLKRSSPLRAAGNLQDIQSLWSNSTYEFEATLVHDNTKPVRG